MYAPAAPTVVQYTLESKRSGFNPTKKIHPSIDISSESKIDAVPVRDSSGLMIAQLIV
jgi:hypothetical protein